MSDMEQKKTEKTCRSRKKSSVLRRLPLPLASLLLILFCGVSGTLAYLAVSSQTVTNTFRETQVSCEVKEEMDENNTAKTSITVKNTSNVKAYIRVKLISYRVNDAGDHIGGSETTTVTDRMKQSLGADWWYHDGFYYYLKPVDPDKPTGSMLEGDLTLTNYADPSNKEYDPDGGKEAIEVMAEAIQWQPWEAIDEAWGSAVMNKLKNTASGTSSEAILINKTY